MAMTRHGRNPLAALLLGVGLMLAGGAHAQTYPEREIRFIVPMAPGGGVDTLARLTAQALSQKVGQSVIVENRAGAGGVLAASYVSRAAPDGYTVFVADTGQLAINPWLYKELPYDTRQGFTPVTEAVSTPLFLAVNGKVPADSVKDLIAYLKKKPGQPFGSTGVGGVHHLGLQTFSARTGTDLVHVPYKGAAPSVAALVAGEVPMLLSAWPSLKGFATNGQVKILAVATAERTKLKPDVPTIAESGLAGFSATPTIGFLLPPGAQQPIVSKLHQALVDVLKDPALSEKLLSMGLVPIANSPAEYAGNIEAESAKYRAIIEREHIKAD